MDGVPRHEPDPEWVERKQLLQDGVGAAVAIAAIQMDMHPSDPAPGILCDKPDCGKPAHTTWKMGDRDIHVCATCTYSYWLGDKADWVEW